MNESTGIAVRRRRSRVEAERLVFEFEQSGVRRQAFCTQHGLRHGLGRVSQASPLIGAWVASVTDVVYGRKPFVAQIRLQ